MREDRRLEKKVAIITGAGSGIGQAAARLFAREGARLVLADVSEAGLRETMKQVEQEGEKGAFRIVDVSSEEQVRELVNFTVATYSTVDILCNNAGIPGGLSSIDEQDFREWEKVFSINMMGAVFGTKHVAPVMRRQKKGAIVNTSSIAGIRSGAGGNAYSASKAALINFTQTSACDLGIDNIRINAVCPGLIETGMTKPFFDYARSRGTQEKLGSRAELRRYGMPEEVAAAILFLACDEASFITGQALAVDGGNTASLNMPGMKV
jgi:NAD(P)-dependent dehydrogenase (short-subunit alcohol dehydrogenase family)